MATLYLRNVPEETGARLADLAAREGMSVSAFAVRELTELSRRADNAALLAEAPDLELEPDAIVAALADGRAERG